MLFLIAVLAPLACGRKTPPKAPELVRPERIESLQAVNRPDGILLSWKRPERYADASRMTDLAGFRVERAVEGEPFEVVTLLQITDRDRFRQMERFRYLDAAVSPGIRYLYRIFSFTLDDYVSQPSNVASVMRELPPA